MSVRAGTQVRDGQGVASKQGQDVYGVDWPAPIPSYLCAYSIGYIQRIKIFRVVNSRDIMATLMKSKFLRLESPSEHNPEQYCGSLRLSVIDRRCGQSSARCVNEALVEGYLHSEAVHAHLYLLRFTTQSSASSTS